MGGRYGRNFGGVRLWIGWREGDIGICWRRCYRRGCDGFRLSLRDGGCIRQEVEEADAALGESGHEHSDEDYQPEPVLPTCCEFVAENYADSDDQEYENADLDS